MTGARGHFASPETLLKDVSEDNKIAQHGVIVINTADQVKVVKKTFAKMYGLGIEIVTARGGQSIDDDLTIRNVMKG
jgi:hypothetical protein